jgi:hypothetical protein
MPSVPYILRLLNAAYRLSSPLITLAESLTEAHMGTAQFHQNPNSVAFFVDHKSMLAAVHDWLLPNIRDCIHVGWCSISSSCK